MKTAQELVAQAKANIQKVPVDQADNACNNADVIIDVREPAEYEAGHLNNAICIPRGVLEFKIGDLEQIKDADTKILIYCKTSGRAALAAQSLAQLGFNNVTSITGGYDAWVEAGKPVVASS
ncbi:rhodanese-like domain-containing protein [Psychrobacter sp. FDAARGOS_221]|uniref:rhodanese-like domain-containing protein n=1 Tax=Psychrobacter sp. FDAARGOS_221 TaxID=1975705 RepID=UPI000BB52DE6|nr:rhodanese-like domain-containing protein [Psychrobacter sp. FDAARGOS_221]PNK59709.1 rhodanese-like domain-containing protein [Psychrobacter sp. FDAARGOS_221]